MVLGRVNYECKESEKGNLKFCCFFYVVKDVKKGEILISENVKSIRSGFGLVFKYYDEVMGLIFKNNLFKGIFLLLEDIS